MAWNGCLWCASPDEKEIRLKLALGNACERLFEGDGYAHLIRRIGSGDVVLMQYKKIALIAAVFEFIPEHLRTEFSFSKRRFRASKYDREERRCFLRKIGRINGLVTLDNVKNKIDAFIAVQYSTTYERLF